MNRVICNMAAKCGAQGLHSSLDRTCMHAKLHDHSKKCSETCSVARDRGLPEPKCIEENYAKS